MNILVTGAAGYIGSHTCRQLIESGHQVTGYDNLSRGHQEAFDRASAGGKLVIGDLANTPLLVRSLRENEIQAVVHFAAFGLVGESVEHPELYRQNNVEGSRSLLQAMLEANVKRLVVSSTTAIYGEPSQMPISEDNPAAPINPYGQSKWEVEQMLVNAQEQHGLGFTALRYFNAAGASLDGLLGEDHEPETHLIPIVLQVALGQRDRISIFGDDYSTPDGTCVRDYVHVLDLASAHVRALERLQPGELLQVNLGSGIGTSVQEIVEQARRVTGHPIPADIVPRRPGDPPCLIANNQLAKSELGWQPVHSDITTILSTAWDWHHRHPRGYTP
ncbi:MAG: UDP-glucose 4-epimerase GalE [Planctomycetaceae bacterium]|nr:UDP-glucose 4-epimerase GalE [Planctomycetaceae bacterium]|tara:strand:+ start:15137 stop:16132 length:996 start_codon:yes stop_codon:yes gene_type:complete